MSKMSADWWLKRWGTKDVAGNKEKIASRKHRKPCDKCHQSIIKGQKYKIDRWMYGHGHYYTEKIHSECPSV